MVMRRFLPFVEEVEVHLLGSGLPSFWVLRAAGMTLTLGLTGFTAANWSQAVSFDLLLPRQVEATSAPLMKHAAAHTPPWQSCPAAQLAPSASVGCASLLTSSEPTTEVLLQTADRRLYAAKHSGRNRVVASD